MTVDNDTTPPAGDPQAGEAAPDDLSQLQRERDDYYDRLLRLTAEFDNYRKRTDRERRELSDYLTMDMVRDLLPVIDDLERALAAPGAASTDNAELAAYHQGVSLIHRQLLEQLRRRGVEPMEVVGQPFDPEWHEAVANEPADGRPDGEITSEYRRGYRIGTRLLRAAMVKVAKA
jgi:molecular chaperone GrpE